MIPSRSRVGVICISNKTDKYVDMYLDGTKGFALLENLLFENPHPLRIFQRIHSFRLSTPADSRVVRMGGHVFYLTQYPLPRMPVLCALCLFHLQEIRNQHRLLQVENRSLDLKQSIPLHIGSWVVETFVY